MTGNLTRTNEVLSARSLRNVLSAARVAAISAALFVLAGPALAGDAADPIQSRVVERSFADARVDLQNAIINQGLAIDFNGHIGDMLKRTAKDVGAKGELYSNAEYFTFCSSVLSRKMMDADIGNMGLCPYVMFVYERSGEAGKAIVGYKKVPARGDAASQAAIADINALLQNIMNEATE